MQDLFEYCFIVNPQAQRGRLGKDWAAIKSYLESFLGPVHAKLTQKASDTQDMTTLALKEGYKKVIAVGGDGTLSGCVNGFFEDGNLVQSKSMLGILPYGRGSDFARALGLSRDFKEALDQIINAKGQKVDVGWGEFVGHDGRHTRRYFLNIANVGLVAHVDNWSHKSPKIIGSKGAYVYGTLRGVLEYKAAAVEMIHDKKTDIVTPINIIIANGPYFGAGMKAAPKAQFDDGKLDIVCMKQANFLQVLYHFPKMYSGDILKIPHVDFFRTSEIQIRTQNNAKMAVEMDGDDVGTLPGSFGVLKKKLTFVV